MKYMCVRCGRIQRSRPQAMECYSRVQPIPDDRVTLCPIDGDACAAPGCIYCKGTGHTLKTRVPSDAGETAQGV